MAETAEFEVTELQVGVYVHIFFFFLRYIVCEHMRKIKANIAKILDIDEQRISVKGKTSESIGFIGRQEGIAALVSTAIQIKDKYIK